MPRKIKRGIQVPLTSKCQKQNSESDTFDPKDCLPIKIYLYI